MCVGGVGGWVYRHVCVCVCVYMYTHTMEYYSTIKKNEILSFAMMWIDLESIMLSEISQTERDKGSVITYMWNLKNKTNVYNKTETTHRYREQTSG